MASNNLSEGFENLCLTGEGPLGAIPKIPNKTETQQNASSPGSNRKAPKKKNRKDRRRSDNEASDSSTAKTSQMSKIEKPSFAVNSSQTAHAPFLQSFSSSVPPPFSNSVSLSLIHSNLNVINSSSSVIQNVSHGFIQSKTDATSSSYPHPQHQQHDSQVDHGPLTRSRKRKLYEDKASEKIYDKSFGKTKVHRTGTIVIE